MRVTTWIVLGCVVLAGRSVSGPGRGGSTSRPPTSRRQEAAALTELSQRVKDQLPTDQSTPQGTTEVTVFPTLAQSLDQLDKGTLSAKKAHEQAQAVIDQAAARPRRGSRRSRWVR